jgi:hypothetical protein
MVVAASTGPTAAERAATAAVKTFAAAANGAQICEFVQPAAATAKAPFAGIFVSIEHSYNVSYYFRCI